MAFQINYLLSPGPKSLVSVKNLELYARETFASGLPGMCAVQAQTVVLILMLSGFHLSFFFFFFFTQTSCFNSYQLSFVLSLQGLEQTLEIQMQSSTRAAAVVSFGLNYVNT